jgi:DtxR family transcriptional regulator, manganese transport regulator
MPSSRAKPKAKPRARNNPPDQVAPPDPAAQAAVHRRTRKARAGEIAQDYVEAIADLIDAGGEARVTDLARRLGVTHVTVVRTIGRLQRDGLVTTKPYRSIFLTDDGRAAAEHARRRHQTVLAFLRAIGVGEQTAQTDAEGIEHHVSEETLEAFARVARARRA